MPRLSPRHGLLGLGALALVLVLLLPHLHPLIPALRATLSDIERLTLDLVQIGLLALILAALLSPLESLGWWAGWYGDQVKTTACPGTVEDAVAADQASRYIVYLDGIGQSQHTYSPEAEEFLQRLGQAVPEMVLIRGIMPYSVLKGSWALAGVKGTISSVLLRPRAPMPDFRPNLQVGDRLLLNHLYGGVGGKMREPAAQGPLYFGHFAYGLAEVVLEPLTDELRLEIQYFQVYAHNGDGLIACRHH